MWGTRVESPNYLRRYVDEVLSDKKLNAAVYAVDDQSSKSKESPETNAKKIAEARFATAQEQPIATFVVLILLVRCNNV